VFPSSVFKKQIGYIFSKNVFSPLLVD